MAFEVIGMVGTIFGEKVGHNERGTGSSSEEMHCLTEKKDPTQSWKALKKDRTSSVM